MKSIVIFAASIALSLSVLAQDRLRGVDMAPLDVQVENSQSGVVAISRGAETTAFALKLTNHGDQDVSVTHLSTCSAAVMIPIRPPLLIRKHETTALPLDIVAGPQGQGTSGSVTLRVLNTESHQIWFSHVPVRFGRSEQFIWQQNPVSVTAGHSAVAKLIQVPVGTKISGVEAPPGIQAIATGDVITIEVGEGTGPGSYPLRVLTTPPVESGLNGDRVLRVIVAAARSTEDRR